MKRLIDQVRDLYEGQTAYIVGKGPSLGNLKAEHFGAGPVIALNQAIVIVEKLGLTNPIYSLQKDGCGLRGAHSECLQRNGNDWMIRPQKAVLVLQDTEGYSRDCLPEYEPRVFLHPVKDLGFQYLQTMAVRMGIKLAKLMGCNMIMMMCCDSLVSGNTNTFNVWKGIAEPTSAGNHYLPSKVHILNELADVRHSFFIPKR